MYLTLLAGNWAGASYIHAHNHVSISTSGSNLHSPSNITLLSLGYKCAKPWCLWLAIALPHVTLSTIATSQAQSMFSYIQHMNSMAMTKILTTRCQGSLTSCMHCSKCLTSNMISLAARVIMALLFWLSLSTCQTKRVSSVHFVQFTELF